MQVRSLNALAGVRSVESEWRLLYELAENRHIFLSADWHLNWLSSYAELVDKLFIFRVYDEGNRLVALLPLYQKTGEPFMLRFIGTGEPQESEVCSEYHDVLISESHREAALPLLAEALSSTGKGLILNNVRPGSALIVICAIAYPAELITQQQVQTRFYLSMSDPELTGSRLKKKSRRFSNLVQRLGGELSVCSSEQTLPLFFDELITLHKKRWGEGRKDTIFDDHQFLHFHRSLARSLLERGELMLASLKIENRPISVFYGFKSGSALYFYQGGIDSTFSPNVSPGTVIHYLVASEAYRRGMTQYDFLGSADADSYKSHLTEHKEPLYRILAYRSRSQQIAMAVFRGFIKVKKRLLS